MDEECPVPRRPSLYTAITLARIVQNVRERLKARVLTRAKQNAIDLVESYSTRTVWGESMIARTRATPATLSGSRSAHQPHRALCRKDINFASLLQDFDNKIASQGPPLTTIAANDEMFLRHDAVDLSYRHMQNISHILDVSTLLIERIQVARERKIWESLEWKKVDASDFQKYLANLEHLLLCFQQASLEALINHSLNKLQSDYQHWDRYLEQQKKVYSGCFSEWIGGRPPLNSTMPWNIKPSLVILWGVCWMFYNSTDNSVSPQGVRQPRDDEATWASHDQPPVQQLWAPQGYNFAQQATDSRRVRAQNPMHQHIQVTQAQLSSMSPSGLGLHVTPHAVGYESPMTHASDGISLELGYGVTPPNLGVALQRVNSTPILRPQQSGQIRRPSISVQQPKGYIGASNKTPSTASEVSFTNKPTWQPEHSTGNPFALGHLSEWQPNAEQGALSTPTSNFYPPSTTFPSRSGPNVEPFTPTTSAGHHSSLYNQPFQGPAFPPTLSQSRAPTMGYNEGIVYPSPPVDSHSRRPSESTPMDPIISPDFPTLSRPERPNLANREPPRNQLNQIYCDHPECAANSPTFARKCEWTKHMDKHTRPYVCHQPGCEKIRGFTYSGGLLRHEREVHKKYGGPKAPRFCPHKDCKRSTGTGFSRKENLHEHLRRVHRGVGIEGDEAQADTKSEGNASASDRGREPSSENIGSLGEGEQRKRKKGEDDSGALSALREELEGLKQTNHQLRMQIAQQDQKLKVFEDMFLRGMSSGGAGAGASGFGGGGYGA